MHNRRVSRSQNPAAVITAAIQASTETTLAEKGEIAKRT
jgi:hypothetical protein